MTSARAILPALLDRAAERDGEQIALVTEGREVTYAQLASTANRIAQSLRRHGIARGDRVLLWLEKSVEAVAAMWGIMKAGAAYVPVDAATPVARLAASARDCKVAALVTTSDRAAKIESAFGGDPPMRVIWTLGSAGPERIANCPVVSWREIERESGAAPPLAIDGEDLVSIQYTSGSTGTPKGVIVPHRALFGQAEWTVEKFKLVPGDRIAGFTPLHSSMVSFDIYAAAAAGATTVLVPPRIAAFPAAVAKAFTEQRVTAWYLVPTLLLMMLNRGKLRGKLSSLRLIAYGGETLALKPLRELMEMLPGARFVHVYARTEVKIRTYHEIKFPPEEFDTHQIGEVPPDVRMLVLDEDQRPVAPGAIGELWIAGPGLMLGYWGLPELTADVMRVIELSATDRVRASRTGDLVRRHGDGRLELIGRADQQIKVRGFRVELGEVEAALQRHAGVERAVVVAEADGDVGRRLRAIVVPRRDGGADQRSLRELCAKTLPRYMIPAVFEFRTELPLTSNGKVDRRALHTSSATAEVRRKR
jgi:amino acid adenylation domain-containing protein